ncbi:MAG: O-antigen ligase family protein [Bacteroidota bacterium]|nr:O-antigen ligase family protein [Bacteroidota bacterium]MDP3147469.1 O-antigen ligase family protein [Bacteroidota bacterium]
MFSEKIHRNLYLFGVCSLAFGIMMGAVPTSVPQFILLGNWIIEGDFKRKWHQLKSNKLFWIISSLFFIHLIGLLYTSDLNAGIKDIRIKLPLLFLAMLFFTTKPLDKKEFKFLLICFLVGSFVNTAWCLLYNFILHTSGTVRDASRFMSHIRLGLYLNVAIACCIYFISNSVKYSYKIFFGVVLLYFIFVLFALGLASGIINLLVLCLFALPVLLFKQKNYIKIISIIAIISFSYFGYKFINSVFNSQHSLHLTENNIPQKFNSIGHVYLNDDNLTQKENGNYVFINIQPDELKSEWQRRFPADSFCYAPVSHNLQRYYVLIRYMASKGLNKDSLSLSMLNDEDFINIKNDVTNYLFPQWNFMHKRIYEFVWEYDEFINERNINGHSLTMRLYFWKAAIIVIKKNSLFGVGTGDVQSALDKTYVETNSPLNEDWYKRPHNQFLTITVALGLFGLLIFLFSFLYPIIILRKYFHALFWPYCLILSLSFILEDTLETQAGLTFYAFFYVLFVSRAFFKKQQNLGD